jgi:hypothetical protein
MGKKTFWQQLRIMDNPRLRGMLLGMGIGCAMAVSIGNWGTGIAVGVALGIALGAAWSKQAS